MLHSSLDDNRPKTKFDFKFRKLEKKGSAVFELSPWAASLFKKEEQTMLFLLDLEEKIHEAYKSKSSSVYWLTRISLFYKRTYIHIFMLQHGFLLT